MKQKTKTKKIDNTSPPSPGSEEAIRLGCLCPVLDNAHGRGYMGVPGIFVHNSECPVHNPIFNLKEVSSLKK